MLFFSNRSQVWELLFGNKKHHPNAFGMTQ